MQNRYRRQSDRPREGSTGEDDTVGNPDDSYVRRLAYVRESLTVQASHVNCLRTSGRCINNGAGCRTCKSTKPVKVRAGVKAVRYKAAMLYAIATNIAIGTAVWYLLKQVVQGW